MIEKIKSHICKGKYQQAKDLIIQELSRSFDYSIESQEKEYADLLALRVTVRTLLGERDDVILDSVRKEKYPSERKFNIGKNTITLLYKNHFLFKSDAYVNTIHIDKGFNNVSPVSATNEFVKRLSIGAINKQIDAQKNKQKGDFIFLNHPTLSAPCSYHIICYESDRDIDYGALRTGIIKVLDDVLEKRLSLVSFFPLGFDAVAKADEDKKNELAEKLSGFIAETVVLKLLESDRIFPKLYFNFVRTNTFQVFERSFYRWSNVDENYLRYQKQLDEKSTQLVRELSTQDTKYIDTLIKLKPELNTKSTILLLGETGVGKSYLAGLIHKYSTRASNSFVAHNCAFINREQLYTTLFGWKRGSYTDAKEDGEGLVQRAEKGTLFLDEIGYMDLDVQKALLTFLDDGIYRRYGDKADMQSDVRLIFGTNQDLRELIRQELFRPDFYERIANLELVIPPMRERIVDIKLIINFLLDKLNKQNKFNLIIGDSLLAKLVGFKWPGNIRQIKGYTERVFNHCFHNNISMVPEDWINSNPPRDNLYSNPDTLSNLENNLANILQKWDGNNGKLLQDVIEPILAKIYIDNLNLPKHSASKILGIDGSGGKKSTLDDRYKKYDNCKKLFDKTQQ